MNEVRVDDAAANPVMDTRPAVSIPAPRKQNWKTPWPKLTATAASRCTNFLSTWRPPAQVSGWPQLVARSKPMIDLTA